MSTIKVTSNGAITLPAKFRKLLGLKIGDYVNAEVEKNRIVIKPAKIIDSEDAWFHTKEWQEKEGEADREIEGKKIEGPFSSSKELIKGLDS